MVFGDSNSVLFIKVSLHVHVFQGVLLGGVVGSKQLGHP